jgi:superfamily II DNA or RNA helicase
MVQRFTPSDLAELLENGADQQIRGVIFELPSTSVREEQPLFRHQAETLERLAQNHGASGIVHLPTGAGKTRIAIEIAARRLRADPAQRVVRVIGTGRS